MPVNERSLGEGSDVSKEHLSLTCLLILTIHYYFQANPLPGNMFFRILVYHLPSIKPLLSLRRRFQFWILIALTSFIPTGFSPTSINSKYKYPKMTLTYLCTSCRVHTFFFFLTVGLSWTSDHLWAMVRTCTHLNINCASSVKSCVVQNISRLSRIYHYGVRNF